MTPAARTVRVVVNGAARELTVPASELLLETVRARLGLTGTKEGCGIGVCGMCTVRLNGKAVSACLTPTVFADGMQVETVEGVGSEADLDPVQRAFVEYDGLQCGVCTPGQILAARALLAERPAPTEGEVKAWMAGNLCRCTGYYSIVESIMAAVRRPE